MFYDPHLKGFLEEIERDLDKLLVNKIIKDETYYILLVVSRIKNLQKDKELRFKSFALQK